MWFVVYIFCCEYRLVIRLHFYDASIYLAFTFEDKRIPAAAEKVFLPAGSKEYFNVFRLVDKQYGVFFTYKNFIAERLHVPNENQFSFKMHIHLS
ncbi:hypothetical protein [Heyndrickxia faecalis]|uniref:hypothetical protein n=1 Tax=Heyndrickxia faecalis TaxID=2824910 RepID=UPI003D25FEE9